jgi:hypothetical protein
MNDDGRRASAFAVQISQPNVAKTFGLLTQSDHSWIRFMKQLGKSRAVLQTIHDEMCEWLD